MPPRGRGIGLGERFEDRGLMFDLDARTGVAHLEAQPHRVGAALEHLGGELDPAGIGEFDRVRQQVGEHLAQPQRVADDLRGQVGRQAAMAAESFRMRARGDELQHVLDQQVEFEARLVKCQLAGFDARQIEQVVDQREHGRARAPRGFDEAALRIVERAVREQLGGAEHAVHGGADLVAHHREEA